MDQLYSFLLYIWKISSTEFIHFVLCISLWYKHSIIENSKDPCFVKWIACHHAEIPAKHSPCKGEANSLLQSYESVVLLWFSNHNNTFPITMKEEPGRKMTSWSMLLDIKLSSLLHLMQNAQSLVDTKLRRNRDWFSGSSLGLKTVLTLH